MQRARRALRRTARAIGLRPRRRAGCRATGRRRWRPGPGARGSRSEASAASFGCAIGRLRSPAPAFEHEHVVPDVRAGIEPRMRRAARSPRCQTSCAVVAARPTTEARSPPPLSWTRPLPGACRPVHIAMKCYTNCGTNAALVSRGDSLTLAVRECPVSEVSDEDASPAPLRGAFAPGASTSPDVSGAGLRRQRPPRNRVRAARGACRRASCSSLPEPSLGKRVGLRVVVDVDVEPVHHVEVRIAEERLERPSLQRPGRRSGCMNGVKSDSGVSDSTGGQRRVGFAWRDVACAGASGAGTSAGRLRRAARLVPGLDLAARPARQEVLVAHRAPFSRSRPSLPSKECGRWRCLRLRPVVRLDPGADPRRRARATRRTRSTRLAAVHPARGLVVRRASPGTDTARRRLVRAGSRRRRSAPRSRR